MKPERSTAKASVFSKKTIQSGERDFLRAFVDWINFL